MLTSHCGQLAEEGPYKEDENVSTSEAKESEETDISKRLSRYCVLNGSIHWQRGSPAFSVPDFVPTPDCLLRSFLSFRVQNTDDSGDILFIPKAQCVLENRDPGVYT